MHFIPFSYIFVSVMTPYLWKTKNWSWQLLLSKIQRSSSDYVAFTSEENHPSVFILQYAP